MAIPSFLNVSTENPSHSWLKLLNGSPSMSDGNPEQASFLSQSTGRTLQCSGNRLDRCFALRMPFEFPLVLSSPCAASYPHTSPCHVKSPSDSPLSILQRNGLSASALASLLTRKQKTMDSLKNEPPTKA